MVGPLWSGSALGAGRRREARARPSVCGVCRVAGAETAQELRAGEEERECWSSSRRWRVAEASEFQGCDWQPKRLGDAVPGRGDESKGSVGGRRGGGRRAERDWTGRTYRQLKSARRGACRVECCGGQWEQGVGR